MCMSSRPRRNFQHGKMLCLTPLNQKMVPIFSTSRFQSFFTLNKFASKASPPLVQKVLGHLKAFRFSIVFNWYVYDQEEDKL